LKARRLSAHSGGLRLGPSGGLCLGEKDGMDLEEHTLVVNVGGVAFFLGSSMDVERYHVTKLDLR
jgi:hypothetical protein